MHFRRFVDVLKVGTLQYVENRFLRIDGFQLFRRFDCFCQFCILMTSRVFVVLMASYFLRFEGLGNFLRIDEIRERTLFCEMMTLEIFCILMIFVVSAK